MAIFIISNLTSNKFYPSQNPINVTLNSNNSGKCNFRFICDVYINNVKVFTDKLFPDPTTGYGFFQLSRVIQDYIQTYFVKESNATGGGLIKLAANTTAPSAAFQLELKFGEEYDSTTTCDGPITQYLNLATSNTAYVFECAIDYEEFPTFNGNSYLMGTVSNTTPFLTNSNNEIDVTYNDTYSVDFITTQTINSNWKVYITTYNSSNAVLATYSTTSASLSNVRRYRVLCGPYDINSIYGSTIIGKNVSYYTVCLKYSNTTISETLTFNVKEPKTFRTRIAFIGLKGGVEHFTFYHRNKTQYNVERKTFNKALQSNYSGQWKYEVGDRGESVYAINAQQQNAVSTYCDKSTSEWLYEMWLSPIVWTYLRPDLYSFRTIVDGSDLKIWVDGEHGIVQNDMIYVFSDNGSLEGLYEALYVDGNIITTDAGWSTSLSGCGWIQKQENWKTLPIVISDNAIEVKQKTGRPIEYSLNYRASYQKTTLRG